jgi:restriction endonuclease Mrr
MAKPISSRHEYEVFIEQAVDEYKTSVPRNALLAIGDEAVRSLTATSQFALTELLLIDAIDKIIFERLALPTFREWRYRQSLALESVSALVDAHGETLSADDPRSGSLILLAEGVSKELIELLARSPELLYQVNPRQFEELVAEVLAHKGVEVSLTPATRDGGRDIVANVCTPLGAFLCYIECKRYAPDRPVGVRPVRELFGIVSHGNVTRGMLVTTSGFTKPAREFAADVPHRLSLRAFDDIVAWLEDVRSSFAKRPV